MPGKNKPKRLDRNRSWRVARRKRKKKELITGNSRNRKPRPKKKKVAETKPIEKEVTIKPAKKKTVKNTAKKE